MKWWTISIQRNIQTIFNNECKFVNNWFYQGMNSFKKYLLFKRWVRLHAAQVYVMQYHTFELVLLI